MTLPAAAADLAFPVVFSKAADMKRLGIVLANYTNDSAEVGPLENGCYYYGDGGHFLSVSTAFVQRFEARGFSFRSLCMALASGIRHDPETGRPLPTYIVKRPGIAPEDLRMMGVGGISPVLPLDVPDCFAGGMPFTDCEMNYDLFTGAPLDAELKTAYRNLGAALEDLMQGSRDAFRGELVQPELQVPVFAETEDGERMELFRFSWNFDQRLVPATQGDYGASFPKGYGYAINLDGTAGPEPSSESVDLADDERREVNEQSLAQLEQLLAGNGTP